MKIAMIYPIPSKILDISDRAEVSPSKEPIVVYLLEALAYQQKQGQLKCYLDTMADFE